MRLAQHFSSLPRGCRTCAQAAAIVGMAGGMAVLTGWLLHMPTLITFLPGAVTMKPNTALCFVLAGIALFSLREKGAATPVPHALRQFGRLCAFLIALIGAATLCEDWFRWNIGLDHWVVRDVLTRSDAIPGRMAPATALSFVLLGLSQLLTGAPVRYRRPAQGLALLVLLIGAAGLLGYVYQTPALYRQPGHTAVAFHTAWLLIILGAGTILARPQEGLMSVVTSEYGGGVMSRRLLPFLVALPFALRWLRTLGQQAGWFDMDLGLVISLLTSIVISTTLVWFAARALNRFDARRAETTASLLRAEADRQRRERELGESERRFRFLADRVPQMIWTAKPDGRIAYYNQRWFDYTGMTMEQTQDWRWDVVVHPDDLPGLTEKWTQAVREGHEYESEHRFKRASDGEYRWHLGRAFPMRDEHGEITEWIGTSTDIEDQRRARAELERRVAVRTTALIAAQKQLAEVLDAAIGVAVIAGDLNGHITLFNTGAQRMLGYRPSEVIGKLGPDLLHLESEVISRGRALTRELGRPVAGFDVFTEYARWGGVESREWTYLHKDGHALTVTLDVSATHNEAGEITGFLGIATDVTERKRAETELRRLQQFHAAILAHIGQGIHGVDADGNIVFENPAAAQMLDCPADELIGQSRADTAHQQADGSFYRVNESVLHGTLRDGEVQRVSDEIFWRKDGSLFPVEYSVAPMRTDKGEITGAVVVFSDISERKQGEAVMVHAREAAEAATRIKGQFLANMSHEIRTPMNGVIGMTNLLLDTELSPEQREYAETIRASADLQLTIINDILDFSKVESGKLVFEALDFDLHETVEATIELLAAAAQKKGIELGSYVDHEVPARLRGDAGRLRQVLTNLIGNAIKFTSEGSVSLHVSADGSEEENASGTVAAATQGARLRFEIKDTGIGIPPEVQGRLFQAFVQADGSTTRKYGGTGLGLAICRQIVEQMGGKIGVRCGRVQGSTFWFTVRLPVQPRAESPRVAAHRWHRARVLVVDASTINKQFMCNEVRGSGMRTGNAEFGAEALAMLRQAAAGTDPYAVAIIDRQLADIDGLALARAIKADPAIAATRLVLLTPLGKPLTSDELASHQIAACRFKPVRQSALIGCIAAVLEADVSSLPQPVHGVRLHCLEAPAAATNGPALASGKRILVAEDNVVNQRVALGQLKKLGHRADAVANGLEALEALARIPYDMVLMDCQMPEMDGYEATAEIRRREAGKHRTWIVAMTANAMKGDREKCLAAGMDDYLSKPTNVAELSGAISRHSEAGLASAT